MDRRTDAVPTPTAQAGRRHAGAPGVTCSSARSVRTAAHSPQKVVAEELLRLVGLTKEQFEQVVLIPQGKFEEVLKADTRERVDLLGRLFPVDVFERTTEALKELAADRRASFDEARASVATLIEQIRGNLVEALDQIPGEPSWPRPDDTELTGDGFDPARLDEHRAALDRLSATLDTARRTAAAELDTARSRRLEAEAAADLWDQWQTDRRAARDFPDEVAADRQGLEALDRARTVSRLAPSIRQWRLADGRVETGHRRGGPSAGPRSSVVGRGLRVVRSPSTPGHRFARRPGRRGRLGPRVRQTPRTRSLSGVDRSSTPLRPRSTGGRWQLHGPRPGWTPPRHASQPTRRALARATGTGRRTRGRTDPRARARPGSPSSRRDRDDAVAEIDRLRTALAEATGAEDLAAVRVIALRTAWRAGLAGRLAEHLVDGEPCPTCGSDHHPAPALPAVGVPTDEELTEAEDTLRSRSQSRPTPSRSISPPRSPRSPPWRWA